MAACLYSCESKNPKTIKPKQMETKLKVILKIRLAPTMNTISFSSSLIKTSLNPDRGWKLLDMNSKFTFSITNKLISLEAGVVLNSNTLDSSTLLIIYARGSSILEHRFLPISFFGNSLKSDNLPKLAYAI